MADESVKVEQVGFGSRLKGSLGGAVFGLLLFLSSFALLWWNEGRTVGTAGALKSAAKKVVSLTAPTLQPANEGKLVHMSGLAVTREPARDDDFGIAPDALRLTRSVEMYQWVERTETKEKEKLGGGKERITTTRYEKSWEKKWVDHGKFKEPADHVNPQPPFSATPFPIGRIKVGDFTLSERFHGSLTGDRPLPLSPSNLQKLPASLKTAGARIEGDQIVTGNPTNAAIGDLRISWTWVPNNLPISIAAMQSGAALEPFLEGKREVSRLVTNTMSARAMFAKAQDENKSLAWLLRVVGFLMMWAGLRMMLGPIAMLLAFLPFLKKLAEIGISVITFLIASALSLVTIAIAWLFYRPALSISLLALAGGAIYLVILYRKRKKQQTASPT